MGYNVWLHFGVDEYPFATYFDVHQGWVTCVQQTETHLLEIDLGPPTFIQGCHCFQKMVSLGFKFVNFVAHMACMSFNCQLKVGNFYSNQEVEGVLYSIGQAEIGVSKILGRPLWGT